MMIPLKGGGEVEIPQDWIDEWNKVYYDVPRTLADIRLWCLDNPAKQKTKRGLRAFVGRWIRKSCQRRPSVAGFRAIAEIPKAVESKDVRLAHLAQLKSALKRGETP